MDFKQTIDGIDRSKLLPVLYLSFEGIVYGVQTPNENLKAALANYFKEWVITLEPNTFVNGLVIAISGDTPDFGIEYKEYLETGKRRVKEVWAEVEEYRIVKKVKTGVHFCTNKDVHYAFGPLEANPNQLINYINSLFMEEQLQSDAMLFHAAGVGLNGKGIVLAAKSGKGKSTTALKLINQGLDFVSNDRIILKKQGNEFTMVGVPKHPRVNPGTLLNNPKVKHILKDPDRFKMLSHEEIWNWEEKYDVLIPEVYGAGKFPLTASCIAFLIIDWGEEDNPLELNEINLGDRPDLLPAIMKTPSLMTPVIHDAHKGFNEADYLAFLTGLPVYILSGVKDPERGLDLIQNAFFA